MLFWILIDIQGAAGHIDLAMEKAEGWNGELIWVLCLAGVPLGRVPGDLHSVQTNLLTHRVGGNQDSSYIDCQLGSLSMLYWKGPTLSSNHGGMCQQSV